MALLAFAHLSTAFASCFMDRGGPSLPMTSEDSMPCCDTAPVAHVPMQNLCVAHCTADLQIFGAAQIPVHSAARVPVLAVERWQAPFVPGTQFEGAPPGDPPPRILLHSFLI